MKRTFWCVASIMFVAISVPCLTAAPILTVTALPETSAPWPAGTTFNGFTSQTANPLAPFSGQSVQFRGTTQGGSTEMLNGASLVARYQLSYSEAVTISSIVVQGAAFNGPNGILRLLNSGRGVLSTTPTFGGNTFQTITLNTPGATGSLFFLDEFDTSTFWRFRSNITVNAVPEPGTLFLLAGACVALFGFRHKLNRTT